MTDHVPSQPWDIWNEKEEEEAAMIVYKIRAGNVIGEHDLNRARALVGDLQVRFFAQPINANPAAMIAKLELLAMSLQTMEEILFGGGSQFQELHASYSLAVLIKYQAWLESANTQANAQRLLQK
jgi:hypothetical protein